MKNIKIEPMNKDDAPEMVEWMAKLSHRNCVDPDIFSYPATMVLKASNGKSIMYLPVQKILMPEAMAINPEASPAEVALSLKHLFEVIEWEARQQGIGEIYFLCSDEETKAFAERHGLKAVEGLTLYTKKL